MKKKTNTTVPFHKVYRVHILAAGLAIVVFAVSLTLFAMLDKKNEYRVVAHVNGEPVVSREFKAQMSAERANAISYFTSKYSANVTEDFWTKEYNGEIPIDFLRKKALERCVRVKVQQNEARKTGIVGDITYAAFMDNLKKENTRRKEAVEKKQVIYGPVVYGEKEYFEYLLSNTIIKLKEKLAGTQLIVSDEECKEFYDREKEKFYKKPDYIKTKKLLIPFNGQKDAEDAKTAAEGAKREAEELKSLEKIPEEIRSKGQMGEQVFDEDTNRQDRKFTPELFSAVEGLKPGGISEVVKLDNGYAVLQCLERKYNGYFGMDEVKDDIIRNLTDRKYDEFIDKLVKGAEIEVVESVYNRMKVD